MCVVISVQAYLMFVWRISACKCIRDGDCGGGAEVFVHLCIYVCVALGMCICVVNEIGVDGWMVRMVYVEMCMLLGVV